MTPRTRRRWIRIPLATGLAVGAAALVGAAGTTGARASGEASLGSADAASRAASDAAHVAARLTLATTADDRLDFGRDVLPILSDRCFACHGPDAAARERTGGLRLDERDAAIADLGGGRAAIVPGDPDASLMLERIHADDPLDRMPPPESGLTLNDDERAILRRWIAEGATYAPHWAFVPPTRPAMPAVEDASWAIAPWDDFVLARLEAEGFTPAPAADRRTLARRAALDLTGLPPTPAMLDAFLADPAPDAYERYVDRLLASEHYGEHAARAWLDVARYADTHGYHHDNARTQWPWRDWVIRAFNRNLPYDRFIVEQLAGDLLPNPTRDQVIATGFNRNHPATDEGGAIDAEYLVEYAADRVATTSTAFMALTMECARCHDHKYDPLPMENYYGLFAFFNSIEERGLNDLNAGKRDGAFPPFIAAPTASQTAELARLDAEVAAVTAAMEDARPRIEAELAAWGAARRAEAGIEWLDTEVQAATSTAGTTLTVLDDGSVLASGTNPATDVNTFRLEGAVGRARVLRLEAMGDPSLPGGRPGRAGNGNAVLTDVTLTVAPADGSAAPQPVRFRTAWASHEQQNGPYEAIQAIDDDPASGWSLSGHQVGKPQTLLLIAEAPFGDALRGAGDAGDDASGDASRDASRDDAAITDDTPLVLDLTLAYESIWPQHALGRVRASVAAAPASIATALPATWSDWWRAGPFRAEDFETAFARADGPESIERLDRDATFGRGIRFTHAPELVDGRVHNVFGDQMSSWYLARRVMVPERATFDLSLGSDDALEVWVDGERRLSRQVLRGAGLDQDQLRLTLDAGEHVVVLKITNASGPGGFAFAATPVLDDPDAPFTHPSPLDPLALVPPDRLGADESERLFRTFRLAHSETARRQAAEVDRLAAARTAVAASIPNVMVMREKPEPTPTYVLDRGSYLTPDETRPVTRHVPGALGPMSSDAPRNRLGLAEWLTADQHPLTARVAVNRFWQQCFGIGLVRTTEDFGLQGDRPVHPELLDWLAVEFVASGWDVKGLLKSIVTSATYRQSSDHRPELFERDPDDRWLARYPRRRLGAESIRDAALHASGLLNPTIGGPSVRPYQPGGLWRERAMPNSDTRVFMRDEGDDLFRRGIYTFWKRSAPPPQMAIFDAPEREFCVAERGVTNTPLQALVLLNDETYVEIARVAAANVLRPGDGTEPGLVGDMIESLYVAFTGRVPEPDAHALLLALYADFHAQFEFEPSAAEGLLAAGVTPLPADIDPTDLAAMTVVASTIINLDETITQR